MVAGAATDNLNNVVLQYKYEIMPCLKLRPLDVQMRTFGKNQVYLVLTFKSAHSNLVLFIILDRVVLAFLVVE